MTETNVATAAFEVQQVTFTGNTRFSAGTLRDVMATRERPVLLRWKRGEPYQPETLEADLLRLKKFYFDRGFLTAGVHVESIREDLERQTVTVHIGVDEGPPTHVEAVHLAGALPPEVPPAAHLLGLLPLRPQQRLTKADFDRSKNLLLDRLQAAGYARAEVVPHTAVNTAQHTVVVTFTVLPGELTFLGRIAIKGARQVKEAAIRDQLTVREGQRYNAVELAHSADAVYELGMFQVVTSRAVNPEASGAPLHVDIEVSERKPRSVQLALGYSTVERFRLQVQWIHRNLLEGAEQLTLSGKLSSTEQKFEARLHFPHIFLRRTALTLTLFARNQREINTDPFGVLESVFDVERDQPAFDLFSVGGEIRLGHRWSRTLSSFEGLSLSRNDFRNVNLQALRAIEQEIASDNLLLIQFAGVQWHTSDSLLNPTQGWLLRGRLDHANSTLVSDVSLVKLLLEARHYQRLWQHIILATRFEVGNVQPYGTSTQVPFNVRFFAGGPGSVRGFSQNRLGPRNAEGDPIGGHSLLTGSVELRFPVLGDLGGAVFADFGNVFRSSFTYRLDDLRYTIGPGVRYNTVVGPVRLDVGVIVDRRPGEAFGRVELSIGQAF